MTTLIRRLATGLAVLATVGVSLAPTGPAHVAASATTAENQVSSLVKNKRAAAGCGPLHVDERLRTIARAHSADMATRNLFSSDGSTFATRIRSTGYTLANSENVAWGCRTPTAVVNAWMNSASRRANILT